MKKKKLNWYNAMDCSVLKLLAVHHTNNQTTTPAIRVPVTVRALSIYMAVGLTESSLPAYTYRCV